MTKRKIKHDFGVVENIRDISINQQDIDRSTQDENFLISSSLQTGILPAEIIGKDDDDDMAGGGGGDGG